MMSAFRSIFAALVVLAPALAAEADGFETPSDYRGIERALRADLTRCLADEGDHYEGARQCADKVSSACLARSPDRETTAGLAICGGLSGHILDGAINAVWARIKRDAGAAEFSRLLAKQRHWLAYREEEARTAAARYEGGSMGAYTGWGVYVEMTAERLARLHEIEAGL